MAKEEGWAGQMVMPEMSQGAMKIDARAKIKDLNNILRRKIVYVLKCFFHMKAKGG